MQCFSVKRPITENVIKHPFTYTKLEEERMGILVFALSTCVSENAAFLAKHHEISKWFSKSHQDPM